MREMTKDARNEGITEEKIKIAKKSLEQGLDLNVIFTITGLSIEEIKKLNDEATL